jgi:putative FmdB family regulatory protein
MPIYEYQCTSCHHTFDLLQKINDEPVKQCPKCSESKAVKLVSAAGFQLKGTGWYATDFKNKGKTDVKPLGSESAPDASKSEKKPTSTTDTSSVSSSTCKGDTN